MKGFTGRILSVDLTTGTIEKRQLDENIARMFIGSQGIDLRLAVDMLKPGIDPLSPENILFFSAGPLVGTQLASRFSTLCKNPLTGAVAFGSGGMGFGPRLKWAGYDHIIITGQASRPVFLRISDDEVEVCDAAALWGKDVYETTDELWRRLGRLYSVIVIGRAGENLVPMSVAFVDRTSTVGKGGLPAVMGSKNLKAIAVRGSKPVIVADEKRFKEIRDQIFERVEKGGAQSWIKFGKMGMAILGSPSVSYKNNTETFPKHLFTELYGKDVYLNQIMGKRIGCIGCPYPCKDLIEIRSDPEETHVVNVSSLHGRVFNLGIQAAGGASFKDTVRMIEIANRLGVDTHIFAPTMMLAVELYKKGIITKQDTGGLELRSDIETTLHLLKLVAAREGFGDILADGSKGIIKRFGTECERYSSHIKGIDQKIEGRLSDFNVKAFSQVTNPEGGDSEPGSSAGNLYPRSPKGLSLNEIEMFCKRMGMSERTIKRVLASPSGFSVPIVTPLVEDFYTTVMALGICEYRSHHLDWPILGELFTSTTGLQVDAEHMKKAGERIWNLFKIINVREGFQRKHDRFPPQWLEPMRDADGQIFAPATCDGRPVTIETFNTMLDEYYAERGWELETGTPSRQKLEELGLSDIG